MSLLKTIDELTRNIGDRTRLMVGRCILRAISDDKAVQLVQAQLLADEFQDDVERIQQYGFTSVPLAGAEGVVVFVGGNRDHGLLIAVEDRRYRLKGLKAGEMAIYDDLGQKVHLTRNGIVVDGAGKLVTFRNTPKVRMETNLEVTGEIKDRCDETGRTMAEMRDTYNAHTHADPQGGSVGTPTGQM